MCHELFAAFDRDVKLESFQALTQSMFEWTGWLIKKNYVLSLLDFELTGYKENYCTQQNIQKLVDSAVSQELKYQERDKREKRERTQHFHPYQRQNNSHY